MNDLYIEPYGETTDYEPIPCSECDEPLDPDTVLLVGDMSERTPHCHACAERIAAAYPGDVVVLLPRPALRADWESHAADAIEAVLHAVAQPVRNLVARIALRKATRRAKARAGATPCKWFAFCERPATMLRSHPILGDVPICDRCDDKYLSILNAK